MNAIGDAHPLGEVLARIRSAAGHRGEVIEAPDSWLAEHGVEYWMGERSLPLWLPEEMSGFMTRDNTAYRAAGGSFAALDDTIVRVLEDERARGVERERRAGLSRADERMLIDMLR